MSFTLLGHKAEAGKIVDRGYVKLWRKSIDSGMLQNHKLWVFWSWCLMKATHKPIKQMVGYQQIDLLPGQFVFGRDKASEETGISPQTIRTCIKHLVKFQNLTIKPTNKFSVITIIKWDTYQPDKAQINQQINQHVTSTQPAANHKQEHKHKRSNTYTSDFEKFWQTYPNKKSGKANAFKSWKKLNGTRPQIDSLLEIIQNQKMSTDWQKENGQFIPMATTWLNQNRWDAEMEIKTTSPLHIPESEKEFTNDPV